MIGFVYDDGGRADAGFKGTTGDCVTRAIAIGTGLPYREAYDRLNDLARRERPRNGGKRSSSRTGFNKGTPKLFMAMLGWAWTPTMQVGSGCTVHLRADELPSGTVICSLSGHWATVIDGVLHDLSDCSRNGRRCVYGYWTPAGAR